MALANANIQSIPSAKERSREAFEDLVRRGAISTTYRLIIEALFALQEANAFQIFQWIKAHYPDRDSKNGVGSRMSELVDCGVVLEVGRKPCPMTGKKCIVYALSGFMPETLRSRSTKRSTSYLYTNQDRSVMFRSSTRVDPLPAGWFEEEIIVRRKEGGEAVRGDMPLVPIPSLTTLPESFHNHRSKLKRKEDQSFLPGFERLSAV